MHLSLALAALTLVFQASAFLIPLEVAEAAEAADLAETQLHTWFTEKTHSYDLECSSCPFPSVNEDGVVVTVEDVATKIVSAPYIRDIWRCQMLTQNPAP